MFPHLNDGYLLVRRNTPAVEGFIASVQKQVRRGIDTDFFRVSHRKNAGQVATAEADEQTPESRADRAGLHAFRDVAGGVHASFPSGLGGLASHCRRTPRMWVITPRGRPTDGGEPMSPTSALEGGLVSAFRIGGVGRTICDWSAEPRSDRGRGDSGNRREDSVRGGHPTSDRVPPTEFGEFFALMPCATPLPGQRTGREAVFCRRRGSGFAITHRPDSATDLSRQRPLGAQLPGSPGRGRRRATRPWRTPRPFSVDRGSGSRFLS